MAMSNLKMMGAMVMIWMVLGSQMAEAVLNCGQVTSAVAPCISYLRTGGTPPPDCCKGVKGLNSAASTTPDRQAACKCLKTASSIPNLNPALAAGLPGKCGVSIPYKISPNTDCSTVK